MIVSNTIVFVRFILLDFQVGFRDHYLEIGLLKSSGFSVEEEENENCVLAVDLSKLFFIFFFFEVVCLTIVGVGFD